MSWAPRPTSPALLRAAVVALASVLVLSSTAEAQVIPPQGDAQSMGLKVGFNRSTMTTNVDNNLDGDDRFENLASARLGLVGGGYIRLGVRPSFSIQPEVLLSQKGVSAFNAGVGGVEIRLTYVEVPLLARFDIPTESATKPYLFAGPAVGALLSGSVRESGSGDNQFNRDEFRTIEVGFVLGGGVDLNGFGVEARFQTGNNIAADDDFELIGARINNRVFSIQLSVPLR